MTQSATGNVGDATPNGRSEAGKWMAAERNRIREECAVIAEGTNGSHICDARAQRIANLIRASKEQV